MGFNLKAFKQIFLLYITICVTILKYLEGLCKSLFDPLFFSGRLPPPCFTTAAQKGNARTTWEPLFLLSAVLNSCVLDSVSRRDAVTRADAHTELCTDSQPLPRFPFGRLKPSRTNTPLASVAPAHPQHSPWRILKPKLG